MKKESNLMWSGIIWGLLVAILFTILGAAIGAAILNSGSVPENSGTWISAIIWAISSFCGIMISLKLTKEKILLTAGITAAVYLLMLMAVNLLIFQQRFMGLWKGIIAVLVSFLVSILLNLNSPKVKQRKSVYRKR